MAWDTEDTFGGGGRHLLDWDEQSTTMNWTYVGISISLVLFAGCMSGLTLGLMSLDIVELEVLRRSGSTQEQKFAERILPVVKNAHYLLVTLLLCNAAAMEALPVVLDKLVHELVAIIISVTAVLFFGEIIPQAVCSKHGLLIGYYMAYPVRALMLITSPISWPISKLLDYVLGGEQASLFRRKQLKALVSIHGTDEGFGGKLTPDEIQIITGALDLTTKTAFHAMTSIEKVFMLSTNQRLDDGTIDSIMSSKPYSRLPVYRGDDKKDILGLILVKELLEYVKKFPDSPVSNLRIRPLPRLSASTPMYDMLKLFRTGRAHMALLTQPLLDENLSPQGSTAGSPLPSRGGGNYIITDEGEQIEEHLHTHHIASATLHPGTGSGTLQGLKGLANTYNTQGAIRKDGPVASSNPAVDLLVPRTTPTKSHLRSMEPLPRGAAAAAAPAPPASASPFGRLTRRSVTDADPQPGDSIIDMTALQGGAGASLGHPTAQSVEIMDDPLQPASSRTRLASIKGFFRHDDDVDDMIPIPMIARPGEPIGIITIEDVIEELMQFEIVDETDKFVDNEQMVSVEEAKLDRDLPDSLKLVMHLADLAKTAAMKTIGRSSYGLTKGGGMGGAAGGGGPGGAGGGGGGGGGGVPGSRFNDRQRNSLQRNSMSGATPGGGRVSVEDMSVVPGPNTDRKALLLQVATSASFKRAKTATRPARGAGTSTLERSPLLPPGQGMSSTNSSSTLAGGLPGASPERTGRLLGDSIGGVGGPGFGGGGGGNLYPSGSSPVGGGQANGAPFSRQDQGRQQTAAPPSAKVVELLSYKAPPPAFSPSSPRQQPPNGGGDGRATADLI